MSEKQFSIPRDPYLLNWAPVVVVSRMDQGPNAKEKLLEKFFFHLLSLSRVLHFGYFKCI